ncbi:MAG: ATP-binding cassette domain-containing protein [Peptococcaceae bacterium]|nr:ATP-binding cassette domain-containing protein [Peptococcaceae bacterium]
MSTGVVCLKNVSCQVGHRYLLQNINFDLQAGSNCLILGENGSGKTTLLSVISGMKHCSAGSVEVFGQAQVETSIIEMRKKIGFVSTSFYDRYYHKESVLNIVLSGKCGTFGIDKNIDYCDVVEAKAILKALNLIDVIDYPFSYLSKGERQNTLLARALLQHPNLFLMDEPMSGLDILNVKKVKKLVKSLAKNKDISMLYVTHHIEEISIECFDYLMLLRRGRIYRYGKIEDLLNQDILSEFFGYDVMLVNGKDGYCSLKVVE